jgi:hypothetical protein
MNTLMFPNSHRGGDAPLDFILFYSNAYQKEYYSPSSQLLARVDNGDKNPEVFLYSVPIEHWDGQKLRVPYTPISQKQYSPEINPDRVCVRTGNGPGVFYSVGIFNFSNFS